MKMRLRDLLTEFNTEITIDCSGFEIKLKGE